MEESKPVSFFLGNSFEECSAGFDPPVVVGKAEADEARLKEHDFLCRSVFKYSEDMKGAHVKALTYLNHGHLKLA